MLINGNVVGSQAFKIASLITYHEGDCIVEIGAQRAEGSSTYLAGVAAHAGVPFYSIDPDPRRIEEYDAVGTLITGKAEEVLAGWDREHPRFTYADGADWPYSWNLANPTEMAGYNALYAQWGGELSERHSARSHLVIADQLARLCTRSRDTIVFDDTWVHTHTSAWIGKGMTAVPMLLLSGWHTVAYVRGIEPEDGYVWVERR